MALTLYLAAAGGGFLCALLAVASRAADEDTTFHELTVDFLAMALLCAAVVATLTVAGALAVPR